jgi:hypothetical protein
MRRRLIDNMQYEATISFDFMETNRYCEVETYYVDAFSYYNLVKQIESLYADMPDFSGWDIERVESNGARFSLAGLGRVESDVIKMNQRRP